MSAVKIKKRRPSEKLTNLMEAIKFDKKLFFKKLKQRANKSLKKRK